MFALPFLLIVGIMAMMGGSDDSPPRRFDMGEAPPPPPEPTQQKSEYKRVARYVTATMQLTDPNEVARRARKLSAKYPQTAQVVMKRARELQRAQDAAKAPKEIYTLAKAREPYPIFNLRWTKFVYSMVEEDSTVTATNHVGYFLFSYPRLVNLGLATNLRKEDRNGRKVWVADFPDLPKFLESSRTQYQAFVKSLLDYLPAIAKLQVIGSQIEGKKVTLSGLLAVAQRAGIDGLRSWLTKPADRTKYPNTTATFLKSTEIF